MRHEINEKIWKNRYFFQWFTHIVGGKILENPSGNLPLVVDIPEEYIHPDGGLVMPENIPEKIRALHEKLNICYDRGIIADIHDTTMWQLLYQSKKL